MEMSKKYPFGIFFIVLVLITLFMMYCNGSSSSYQGYDFYFHYRRLHTLIDSLREGTYPFYIDYSNVDGYGYFTKGFYPDVVLVPFAIIGLFTSTFVAYDVMIFTMTVLCGVLTYNAVNFIFKSSYVAILTSILYTFAVYRLYDVYQRGALGESLSFTFLPIIFLGLYHIIKGDYKKWYILAIGYSLLIFTHLISSVLMFITLIIILGMSYKSLMEEPKRIGFLFLAGIVTVIITSYYTFPLFEQLASNSFLFEKAAKAGYGKVGFDIVLYGFVSGLFYPYKYIWSGVGVILTALIFLRFFIRKISSKTLKWVDMGVIVGILFIISSSKIFPWGTFPFSLIGFIQFPWRLYEFSSLFFALAGSYYLSLLFTNYKSRSLAFVIIIFSTLLTTYISSENYKNLFHLDVLRSYVGESDENPSFQNRYHLIGAEYFPTRIGAIDYTFDRGEKVEFKNIDTDVSNIERNKYITSFDVCVNSSDSITLPLIYYKGYNVTLNGMNLLVDQGETGLVKVSIDKSGRVEASYKGTTIQKVSFYISVLSSLLLIGFILITNKRKYGTNR